MEEKNLRVSGSFDLHSLDSTNSKIASIPANFNISAFNGLAQIQQLKVEFDMSDEDGFLRGIKLTNKSDYDMYPLRVVTVVHCKNDSDTDLYIAHDQFDRSSDLSNKTSVVVPLIQPEGSVYFDRASLRNNLIKKGCSESSEAKLLEFKAQETNPSLFGRTVFEWFDVPGGEISIW